METTKTPQKFKRVFNVISTLNAAAQNAQNVKSVKKETVNLSKDERKIDRLILKAVNHPTWTGKKLACLPSESLVVKEPVLIHGKTSSIDDFLRECHPDVLKFINNNGKAKMTMGCGEITIITDNKFRVNIEIIGKYSKKVVIKDPKGKVVVNAVQNVHFVKTAA